MRQIVIIGAGGHGREVAEILRHQSGHGGKFSVLGFVDDAPHLQNMIIGEFPVLGNWDWFEGSKQKELEVICAIGAPEIRRSIVQRAIALGLSFGSAISPHAYVSPTARIGRGVMILPQAVVSSDCSIEDHAIINVGSTISHDSKVGCYGTVNPGVHLAGNVSIGEGCYLGMGANVIHGVSIGPWSVVGSGAVVTDDLPSRVTAIGVPARIIKTRNETE